jgi:hypothetical protein
MCLRPPGAACSGGRGPSRAAAAVCFGKVLAVEGRLRKATARWRPASELAGIPKCDGRVIPPVPQRGQPRPRPGGPKCDFRVTIPDATRAGLGPARLFGMTSGLHVPSTGDGWLLGGARTL